MTTFDLGFGSVIQLTDNLAEVIINEGVEMDMGVLEHYHDWIETHMNNPCFLLVNKLNSYTYTFEAQQHLAELEKVKAIAVVCYSSMAEKATNFVAAMPRKTNWELKTFDNRKAGLDWLMYCQGELRINPQ